MRSFWATFFALLSAPCVFSQVKTLSVNEQPLTEVIPEIEAFYEVKISYIDEAVGDKKVSFQVSTEKPLADFMGELERRIHVRFEIINDHYIIIRPFTADDLIEICGLVIDEDQNPVSGLLVRVDQENLGAITNDEGYFQLSAPYHSILTFSHLGFIPKRKEAKSNLTPECGKIVMKSAFSMLEDLVIEDYLTVGITKKKKDIEILPQELKILPGLIEPDILQSIQQIPGVSSPYETASGIHVRGGSPDQNLILWNGIKTYNQGHFFGMLSAFNPYITEHVTFIKNGTSAAYGDRVSSVIDIKTSEDVVGKFSGGGGFNMIYGDGYINVPVMKDKLSILVSGRRSYTDVLETFTYNQFSKRVFQNTKINEEITNSAVKTDNQFYFNDFNSNIVFQPSEKNKILVNTLYSKNDLDFLSNDENSGQGFNDRLRTENEGYNLKWVHEASRFSVSSNVYYSKYLLKYQFLNSNNDTTEVSSKKNLISDLGFGLDGNYVFSDTHKFSFGYQISNNNTRYAFEDKTPTYHLVLDQDNRTVVTNSLYSEYRFDSERTYLSAGVRLNHYGGLDHLYVEPRFFIEQRLAKPLAVNASAEYRTQVMSQIKESVVSDLSLENQIWKLASKERFPVIDSYQITSGLVFNKNHWYLDVEAYHKKINGVTTLTFGFLNPVDNQYRIGNSTIHGIDFFIKKQIRNYKTWLGYSYIHTENTFVGVNGDKPFPGNWNIRHDVKWSHFYAVGDFQFSLGWSWHTGKSYTDVQEVVNEEGPVIVTFDGINGNNLPVYHRLDFSALYDFNFSGNEGIRYRIGLSVLNLYNRKNLLNREFRTTPSLDNELIDTKVYSLGITPNLVFRVFW